MRDTKTEPSASEIAQIWASLSVRERLARLLLIRSAAGPDGLPSEATLAAAAAGVGGFHGPPLHAYPPLQAVDRSREFIAALRAHARRSHRLEPLIAANAETGLAYTTGAGGTDVPYPAALGELDPTRSRTAGRAVGQDLRASGYDWCFQPVADVRSTLDDPVIGVRAFGSDPELVAAHVREYGLGLQDAGVIATVKHLPGHGDASVDSHHGRPMVARTAVEQDRHLRPFAEAARARLASMMTAHMMFEDAQERGVSTFDPAICTDLVRHQLGFEGILVSDSLRMKAVSAEYSPAEAAVLSLRAGCDVANVKCPPEQVGEVLDGLEHELAQDRLSEERVYEAFTRMLTTQMSLAPNPDPTHQVAAEASPILADELRVAAVGQPQLDVAGDDVLTVVMYQPPGEAPDAEAFGATLSRVIGRPIRVQYEFTPQIEVAVIISYGQAGPTTWEQDVIARTEQAGIPAVVFLAGAPDLLERYTGALPAVAVPALDVFGMPSLSGFSAGFGRILGR